MKKWLQKRSFMVTIAFVIILIGIVVWFLIGTKTFGYYFHGAKIKNVEYIEVRIDGGEEDDIYKNQYKIEDSKNIEIEAIKEEKEVIGKGDGGLWNRTQ